MLYARNALLWEAEETVCISECYAVIKKETLPFVTTWMGLRGIMLSEIRQRKTDRA